MLMLQTSTEIRPDARAETVPLRERLERLRAETERLRAENERLRDENRHLRAALDAHVARARSTSLFGPLELTAGTSVGPRRAPATRHHGVGG